MLDEEACGELQDETERFQTSLLQSSFQLFEGPVEAAAADDNYGFASSNFEQTGLEDAPAAQMQALPRLALSSRARDQKHNVRATSWLYADPIDDNGPGAGFLIICFAVVLAGATLLYCKVLQDFEEHKQGKRVSWLGQKLTMTDGDEPQNREMVSEAEMEANEHEVFDIAVCPPTDIDEDTFGISVCALTRDSHFMAVHGFSIARSVRVVGTIFLVVVTVFIQAYLLSKITTFVTARAVHDIRESYDQYEMAMCGQDNTYLTVNGKNRCKDDNAFPSLDEALTRLNNMDGFTRDNVCRIPLSQPMFFGVVLMIWTLIVLGELRKALNFQIQILMLETLDSMADSMVHETGEDAYSGIITGMTWPFKVLVTVLMFIPRTSIAVYLLWVGCRLLLATTSFSDLIMNAVGLEFVLLIKDTLYFALVPARSHLDLTLTKITPYPKKLTPHWFNFASSFFFFGVSLVWVLLYMYHFQSVLPDYKWDVHEVCIQYIKERYST
jgi:hypothetical protein